MQNEALYQKYRSQAFDEVVGQEYVVKSIYNAIKNNKVSHAYLFCGPRGTGKTTMARLLARAVNCDNKENAPCGKCTNCEAAMNNTHPDIIEINAANETHVEDIRDLIERARLAPMMGDKKIYIIDEVHQLSSSAASALLKTLEEPPEHVIFILATTDPQKLLGTIISRCQRFDFSKVPTEKIQAHLLNVAKNEKMKLEDLAALKIAQLADGGMRDALSMLEQAASYSNGNIQEKDIDEIYGLASTQEKLKLIDAILNQDLSDILQRSEEYSSRGIDIKRLTSDLMEALKESVIYGYTKNKQLLRTIQEEEAQNILSRVSTKELLEMIEVFMNAQDHYRSSQSLTNTFEIACMNVLSKREQPSVVEQIVQPIEEVKETKPVVEEKPKAEKKKATKKQETKNVGLDSDKILGLLVQCDKESKASDEKKLEALLSSEMNRYVACLKQVQLKASGKDCMLFTTDTQAVANTINDEEMNKELYLFVKEKASLDKMLYALTNQEYEEAVQRFITCRKENTLPNPYEIQKYKVDEKKGEELSTLEKLQEAFPDDDMLVVYD